MTGFFRSISQRFRRPRGDSNATQQINQENGQRLSKISEIDPKKGFQCKILLLDSTNLNFIIPKKALGQEVYDRVFQALDLEERDYFGLQFTDHYHVHHWLDPLKKISKQVPIGPPYTFRFRVKFYSSEPSNLRDELTRYQFFLQLKNDIQTGSLQCPKDVGIELAALALQSEFGDYNPLEHNEVFVSEFRFHPEQDAQMEEAISNQFKSFYGQNLTPDQAELSYLNKVKWLEFYGVDMHVVAGRDGNEYRLGLTPTGMLVFDGLQKIGLFSWETIQRLDFRNRKLTLVVEDADQTNSGQIQLHTFVFELASHKACKHLWKCAIEHHTFFRLKFHKPPKHARGQLFRLGSTFKYRFPFYREIEKFLGVERNTKMFIEKFQLINKSPADSRLNVDHRSVTCQGKAIYKSKSFGKRLNKKSLLEMKLKMDVNNFNTSGNNPSSMNEPFIVGSPNTSGYHSSLTSSQGNFNGITDTKSEDYLNSSIFTIIKSNEPELKQKSTKIDTGFKEPTLIINKISSTAKQGSIIPINESIDGSAKKSHITTISINNNEIFEKKSDGLSSGPQTTTISSTSKIPKFVVPLENSTENNNINTTNNNNTNHNKSNKLASMMINSAFSASSEDEFSQSQKKSIAVPLSFNSSNIPRQLASANSSFRNPNFLNYQNSNFYGKNHVFIDNQTFYGKSIYDNRLNYGNPFGYSNGHSKHAMITDL